MSSSSLLLQSVSVTVGAGGTASFTHSLNLQGQPLLPNIIQPTNASPLLVTAATTTDFTVDNPDSVNAHTAIFYVEYEHSYQRDALDVPLPELYWQGIDSTGLSAGTSLQGAYDGGAAGVQQVIVLGGGGRLGVAIRDAAVPIGATLFEVTNNGDTSSFLDVSTTGISTSQGVTLLNSTVGVSAAGSVRLRSSGGVLQVSQNGAAYQGLLTTLQGAYSAGSAGQQIITLNATQLGITISDAAVVGGNLFSVSDGTNSWFSVRSNAVHIGANALQFREVPGTGPFAISVQTPTAANTAGFALSMAAGTGSASNNSAAGGAGAALALTSGTGGAGGAAQIAGIGGAITLTAGNAGANNGGGGAAAGGITLTAGTGTGAGASGDVTLVAGTGTATSTVGRIVHSVTDTATATVTDAAVLSHTSTGTAAANYGTGLLMRGQDAAGTAGGDDMIRLAATWNNAGSGTEVSQLLIQTRTAGGALATTATFLGTGTFTSTGIIGTTGVSIGGNALLISTSGSTATYVLAASKFGHAFTRTPPATGSTGYFTFTPGASTNRTLSTEIIEYNFVAGSKQWATGALATQREVFFGAPTYSFVGASTLTTAGNVVIGGAPIASTNATITNSYALWVQADSSRFDGRVIMNAPNSAIADAALQASSLSFYLNEAGNTMVVKAKYADGTTIKTGTVALT